jgi:endoglucanase
VVNAIMKVSVLARYAVIVLLFLPLSTLDRAAPPAAVDAVAAAREFLDDYVDDDGRVVRRDQGGDTVSEAQAYAMLIAVAVMDEPRFERIWAWTIEHLRRADALFAWRWADGQVADWEPSTDADLAIASALVLGGERFGRPDLLDEADRLAAAILDHQAIVSGGRTVLVAGPWAVLTRTINPSYFMNDAIARLATSTDDPRWGSALETSRDIVGDLTHDFPHLPPDWAEVAPDGGVAAASGPDGRSPRYGFEAVRVFVQFAVDCSDGGRSIAARGWDFFGGLPTEAIVAEFALTGEPLVQYTHPVALVAAAATAEAAGHREEGERLLDAASELHGHEPSYYGGAWIALGRLWLHTPHLGGCRPS